MATEVPSGRLEGLCFFHDAGESTRQRRVWLAIRRGTLAAAAAKVLTRPAKGGLPSPGQPL